MGDTCPNCGSPMTLEAKNGDVIARHYCTPAPSPTRDDAEKAIAGLLAEHSPMRLQAAQRPNGLVWECCNEIVGPYELEGEELEAAYRAHVASVIAAHMAEADELTTAGRYASANEVLLAERDALRTEKDEAIDNWKEAEAELDALRERIRALAEESADYCCKSEWDQRQYDSVIRDLRAIGGDA